MVHKPGISMYICLGACVWTGMVCDDDSKARAYGECSAYKNKKFNFNPPDDAVATRPITYTQWKRKKVPRVTTDDENAQSRQDLITVIKKEAMDSTMKDIGDFMTCLKPFKWHAYNIMKHCVRKPSSR